MRRILLWIPTGATLAVAVFGVAVILAMRPGNPALFPVRPGDTGLNVNVVSHGYHSGLALRRDDLLRMTEMRNLPALEHVPEKWNRFSDKDMLQLIKLERVLIAWVIPPKRNAL